jgi:hypothetical protein
MSKAPTFLEFTQFLRDMGEDVDSVPGYLVDQVRLRGNTNQERLELFVQTKEKWDNNFSRQGLSAQAKYSL